MVRGRRGHGRIQRERLLNAAEALLLDSGDLAAVSVAAICAAAECTPPTLYFHFGTKDALVLTVVERHFRNLAGLMDAAAASTADPVQALHARGIAYVRFGLHNPEHYRILLLSRRPGAPPDAEAGEADDPAARVADVVGFGSLVDTVAAAQHAGMVVTDVPALTIALQLWAMVHGLTALLTTVPGVPWGDLDAMVTSYVTAAVRGFRRSTPGPSC